MGLNAEYRLLETRLRFTRRWQRCDHRINAVIPSLEKMNFVEKMAVCVLNLLISSSKWEIELVWPIDVVSSAVEWIATLNYKMA